jgi:siroheme synthase
VDWSGLPATGTLVCLMGVSHLPEIARRLVGLGRSAETPAAVIGWGTTGRQVVVEGTLADIAERAVDVEAPATIVIGAVVALREKLAWYGAARERAGTAPGVDWDTLEALLPGIERRTAAVEVR